MNDCNCKLCQTGIRLRSIGDKLPPDDAQWLRAFGNEYLGVSSDAAYYESILKGDWPDSVGILTRALERAKAKESGT